MVAISSERIFGNTPEGVAVGDDMVVTTLGGLVWSEVMGSTIVAVDLPYVGNIQGPFVWQIKTIAQQSIGLVQAIGLQSIVARCINTLAAIFD